MTEKELEEQMLELMTEEERETYWKEKLGKLLYSKYGKMSNKERRENGVWFQDEQGMKDD